MVRLVGWRAGLLAILAVAGFSGGALATVGGSADMKVTVDRSDIVAPSNQILFPYTPEVAFRNSVSGRILMRCIVSASHRLEQCKSVAEAPARFEFALAGERISRSVNLMAPQAAPGQTMMVPVSFKVGGTPLPRDQTFLVDDGLLLIPAKAGKVPCPTATDPQATCRANPVKWSQAADFGQMRALLSPGAPKEGVTQAVCQADQAMGLTDCDLRGLVSPEAAAAMDRILAAYRPAPQAENGKDVSTGRVLLEIDWARLASVLEAFGN